MDPTAADGHDWDAMVCGCTRPAGHVGSSLALLLTDGEASGITAASFDGHLHLNEHLYAPVPAAVSVLLGALADDGLPVWTRDTAIELLDLIAFGSCTGHGVPEGRDLFEQIRRAVSAGLDVLYAEIASGRSAEAASRAFWIVEGMDDDTARVEQVRRDARHLLREACQTPWA